MSEDRAEQLAKGPMFLSMGQRETLSDCNCLNDNNGDKSNTCEEEKRDSRGEKEEGRRKGRRKGKVKEREKERKRQRQRERISHCGRLNVQHSQIWSLYIYIYI